MASMLNSIGGVMASILNSIGGVTASMLTSSAVDRGLESRSGQRLQLYRTLVFAASVA
jgi:hypothetical protein